MENEKKLRLIQVAKEFKVGLNTITDYLHKKGVNIESSPNTQIDSETYAMVEKEFGSNRSNVSARDNVREKIAAKQASVSIKEEKPAPAKSIEVKDEVAQPKILGKVEIDKKGNIVKAKPQEAKPVAAPAPKVENSAPKAEKPAAPAPKAEPKVEAPKPQPAVPESNTEAPKEVKRDVPEFRPTEAPTLAGPQILGKIDVSGMVPGGKH
ncbi:MAG: translation initiation factor IF-2, partial [Alistipes sp.]|nr:translation initiation factor IF-2 [Alistipes sp.]